MLAVFNVMLMCLVALYGSYMLYQRKKAGEYVKMLGQQEHFMGNLLSEYSADQNLSECLINAMRREDSLFNKENNKMIDALLQENDPETFTWFIRHSGNSFLSLLFALCATIRTYGDSVYNGVSLFSRNLRYIKDELRAELLLCEERKYQFSGLLILAAAPFFFTMLIQGWAVGISPDMAEYFAGLYGILTLVLCFIITVGSMWMISLMEYDSAEVRGENIFVKWFLGVDIFNRLLDHHIASHYSRYLRLNDELKKMSVYSDIKLFMADRLVSGLLSMASVLIILPFVFMRYAYIIPVWMILSFVVGYYLPKIRVIIYHYRNRNKMMEETLRLQTLVLLLMHYREITVEEILSWMERFADIFRNSIERAVDDFSYKRQFALNRLAQELKYEPAVRLAESMAACDEIPVERAFYDLENEREYYMEQYKQNSFDSLKERAAISKLVAYAPFVAVLATRLIIPFVLVGLNELSKYSGMLG